MKWSYRFHLAQNFGISFSVQIAVRWLKLLLQIHASLLIALGKDELHERFGSLIGIIDNRTNSLAKLSA